MDYPGWYPVCRMEKTAETLVAVTIIFFQKLVV